MTMKERLKYILLSLILILTVGISAGHSRANSISYLSTPPNSGLNVADFYTLINGSNSFVDSVYPQVTVVTKGIQQQKGGMYAKQKVNLSSDFTFSGSLYMHNTGASNGWKMADGMAVIFQNDSRGPLAIGQFGSALGYNGTQEDSGSGAFIHNAYAGEFDPYLNYVADAGITEEHVAWQIPQSGTGNKAAHLGLQQKKALFSTFDGTWMPVTVTWRRASSSSYGGDLTLTYGPVKSTTHVNDYREAFKTDSMGSVYFGFVGSTGGQMADQAITVNQFDNPEPLLTNNKSVYNAEGSQIDGKTVSGGQILTYKVQINNPNPHSETGPFRITDVFPASQLDYAGNAKLTIDGVTMGIADSSVVNGNKIDYIFNGNLGTNQSLTLSFDVKVKAGLPGGTKINNTATTAISGLSSKTNTTTNIISSSLYKPTLTKKVKNLTTKDTSYENQTTGHIGDKVAYQLEYTVGSDSTSALSTGTLYDFLPTGLDLDSSSINVEYSDGTVQHPTSLEGVSLKSVPIGKTVTIDFTATINSSVAVGNIVKNIGTVVGMTSSGVGTNTASNEANVTIEKAADIYKHSYTKQVKNVTTGDTSYQNETTGHVGDIVAYRLKYTVDANNTTSLASGSLSDTLPDGLDLDDSSINLTYSDGTKQKATSLSSIPLKAMPIGSTVTVDFNTIINATAKTGDILRNMGHFSGSTSANDTVKKDTNLTEVNILASKASTPTITKQVSDTTNDPNGTLANIAGRAHQGDSIFYQVKVMADAETKTSLSGVKLQDVLPSDFQFQYGLIAIVQNGVITTKPFTAANIMNNTLDIDAIAGGKQVIEANSQSFITISFIGKIKDNLFEGTTDLNKLFTNQASIVDSSYGNNGGKGWPSNIAVVEVNNNIPKLTKEVKKQNDPDSDYVKDLDVDAGDKVNYRVSIEADKTHPATLQRVVLKDDFTNHLGVDLILNGVTVHYYDKDGNEITTDKETLTPDSDNAVTLTHDIGAQGKAHAEVIYDVTVNSAAKEGTIHNTALMLSNSYGLNTTDNNRSGWVSNDATINISSGVGNLQIRYVDLDEDLATPDAAPTKIAEPVSARGKVGDAISTIIGADERVAPKLIEDYTVVSVTEDSDLTNATWDKAYKDDPKFTKEDRIITYGYKKRMISLAAPEKWDFGLHDQTKVDKTYYLDAHETPETVKVVDNYGVASWQLQVGQKTQFVDPSSAELTGAQLRFENGAVKAADSNTALGSISSINNFTLNPGSDQKVLMTFTKLGTYQNEDINQDNSSSQNKYTNPGQGVWNYNFGNKDTADESIGLHVPATTTRNKAHYTTQLDWTLTVAH